MSSLQISISFGAEGARLYRFLVKTAAIEEVTEKRFLEFLKEVLAESQQLRRTNRELNARINRSNAAIDKNLEEIQKNIDYVKAAL